MTSFLENIPEDRLWYIALLANIDSELNWLCRNNCTTLDEVCKILNISPNVENMSLLDISKIVNFLNGGIKVSCY